MGVIRLVETLVFLLGAAVLVTQVIIPLFKGTHLFPFLRKERREMNQGFTDVTTALEDKEMQGDLEELKRALFEKEDASEVVVKTETQEK